MLKVIIWGLGKGYNQIFNLIKYYETLEEINVIGVFSDDSFISQDGYKVYEKKDISKLEYDYCIVTIQNFKSILDEAISLGIERQKIIPARVLTVPNFNFKNYDRIKKNGISIISRNCWAGFCYNYLGLEFQTPTINLYFDSHEFNNFVKNFDYYMTCSPKFLETGYDKYLSKDYPIALLDDLKIHFNHYSEFEKAAEDWERRKRRVNENKLIISSTESKAVVEEFIELPFDNKLMFVPNEMSIENKCLYHVDNNATGKTIGAYCNGFANGAFSGIDLIALCCNLDFRRNK